MRSAEWLCGLAVLGSIACTDVGEATQVAALSEPTDVIHVSAPLTAARFTALTGRAEVAALRISATSNGAVMPDLVVQAVTSGDDDHYTVIVNGLPVRLALPGYHLAGAQLAAVDPDEPVPSPLTAAWLAAQQAQANALLADAWGGFADYQAEIQQDMGGPADDPPPGGGGGTPPGGGGGTPPGGGGGTPPGGGGGTLPGGGSGSGGMPLAAHGPRLQPRTQAGGVVGGVTDFVCGTKWTSFLGTTGATALTATRSLVGLAAKVTAECGTAVGTAGALAPACAAAMARVAATKSLLWGLGIVTAAHLAWDAYVKTIDHDYELARIGLDKNAELDNVAARRTNFKNAAIGAAVLGAGDSALIAFAAANATPGVVLATMSYLGTSGAFITCGFNVLSPKANNDAVRVAVNMDGNDDLANAGGGGFGGLPVPPPPGGGAPGPVGTSDSQRRFMSNRMTALPRALAMQNVMTIDLRSRTSPFTGQPADNQISSYRDASHPDAWGVGLCTVLQVDSDPGGPYQAADPLTSASIAPSQPAHTPYLVQGSAQGWGADMHAASTDVHGRQGMLERICDVDNDNDGIPDAQQAPGRGACDFAGPDQTDGLISLSIDSPQPNRAPDAHANCAHVGMSLVPHPQDNDIPGLTAEQILPLVIGKWVSTRWIFSVSDQYATSHGDPTSFGSSQLRFEVGGTLQAPDNPCLTYQKIMDPPWVPTYPYHHDWAWDASKPGCALSPGMP